jgi:hypothetical protein
MHESIQKESLQEETSGAQDYILITEQLHLHTL